MIRTLTYIFCHIDRQNLIGHRHNSGTRHGVIDLQLQTRKSILEDLMDIKHSHSIKTLDSQLYWPRWTGQCGSWAAPPVCGDPEGGGEKCFWFFWLNWLTADRGSLKWRSELWWSSGSYFSTAEVLQVSFSHRIKGRTAGSEDGDRTRTVYDWRQVSFLQSKETTHFNKCVILYIHKLNTLSWTYVHSVYLLALCKHVQ